MYHYDQISLYLALRSPFPVREALCYESLKPHTYSGRQIQHLFKGRIVRA